MRQNSKFARGSGVYVCHACGKQTRETGAEEGTLELCRRCLLEAYAENAASDYGKDSDEARQAVANLADYDAKHPRLPA